MMRIFEVRPEGICSDPIRYFVDIGVDTELEAPKIKRVELPRRLARQIMDLQKENGRLRSALERIRPVPEMILRKGSVRCLDEILSECDSALR